MAKLNIKNEMKKAKAEMDNKIKSDAEKKEKRVKKTTGPKKKYYKTVAEQNVELRESRKPKVVKEAEGENYEETLIKSLFENDPIIEVEEEVKVEEKPKRERSGTWDYVLEDEIKFFDPECSYEITGYIPIDETHSLDFDPAPFMETGRIYTETGAYCQYPQGSKPYNDFWMEQLRRCTEGYKVGKYRITSDHYFFLNFYRMNIVDDTKKAASGDTEGFPKFLVEQYKFFHYFEMCEHLKKDVVALKSRGIGCATI